METVFHIPGQFAQACAGRLSGRRTMFVPVRTALGVTCPDPPIRAYVVRELASGSPPEPPEVHAPIGVCAQPNAGVGHMYVSIPFGIPAARTPKSPWA